MKYIVAINTDKKENQDATFWNEILSNEKQCFAFATEKDRSDFIMDAMIIDPNLQYAITEAE